MKQSFLALVMMSLALVAFAGCNNSGGKNTGGPGDQVQGGGQTPAGVPGALSNQPPVPATAPIVTPASAVAEASGSTGGNLHKEATTNFEVDRTIRYTKLPVGSIKRLSVAVVVNNRMVADKTGKTTSKPLSENEKEQITALVKEAMGYSASRGDTLNVLNSEFNVEKEAPVAEVPLWKQGDIISLAKDGFRYLIIAGIAMFLLFGVIRPAFKNFEAERQQVEQAKEEAIAKEQEAVKAEEELKNQGPSYEQSLQGAKMLAQNDPKVVAAVIKEWVSKDE